MKNDKDKYDQKWDLNDSFECRDQQMLLNSQYGGFC